MTNLFTAASQGNFIGTDANATDALGNHYHFTYNFSGVLISSSPGNLIGGTMAGAGNLISRNYTRDAIQSAVANGHVVHGDYISTDVTGTWIIGNTYEAVSIYGGASQNIIGSPRIGFGGPVPSNIISGNDIGVVIGGSGTVENVVQGNYI